MPKITVKKLTSEYTLDKKTNIVALNEASVVFNDGEISVIIGSSGSGKTTLARSIIGLGNIKSGSVLYDDKNVTYLPPSERNVSYVNQDLVLFPKMNVFNNIAFPLKISGVPSDEIRERVKEISILLGVEKLLTRKIKEISIGQAQRVLIAKALIKRATIYVFDEPFSNLDKATSMQLTSELKKIFSKLDSTVIFISHDIQEAIMMADKIFVMEEGKIIASDSPRNLLKSKDKRIKPFFVDL
mgnify:CR=1 FL=1